MNAEEFDVAIVGAGPGGATTAWYLARSGRRVVLFERLPFPRDKICGDAVVPRAQIHLERMGVLPRLVEEGKARPALKGGFVSPAGVRAIGDSSGVIVSRPVLAIKRRILDEEVARAAAMAGADLRDGCPVTEVRRDPTNGRWTITAGEGSVCTARALVASDGANSRTARSLGLVSGHPTAFCSRAYIKGGANVEDIDGMAFYRNDLLPGYAAIFREADGDLNFCCYIMPGGPSGPDDLREMHDWFLRDHPVAADFVAEGAEIESMRSAPLRIGGVARSFADGFLAVGDAAGQIDPLSGEGIQFAMDAAEMAAATLHEGLNRNDLSECFLSRYQEGWMDSFGRDFRWSSRIAALLTKHPRLLDLSAAAAKRKGGLFFQAWGQIMTAEKPKSQLFRPGILLPVVEEILRDSWRRVFRGGSLAGQVER